MQEQRKQEVSAFRRNHIRRLIFQICIVHISGYSGYSGYSDYFVNLANEFQNNVIERNFIFIKSFATDSTQLRETFTNTILFSFYLTSLQKHQSAQALNNNNPVNSIFQTDARIQPVKEVQHLQQQRLIP